MINKLIDNLSHKNRMRLLSLMGWTTIIAIVSFTIGLPLISVYLLI